MTDLTHTLGRLAAILGEAEGEPEPLEGGITNRNFKVYFGGVPYAIREPGKDTSLLGIDRAAEWAASCAAARAGVGPAVRAMLDDPPVLVTTFVDGEPVTEEQLAEPDRLATVAGALRRIHDCGETLPSAFSAFRIVEEYEAAVSRLGGEAPEAYAAAHERAGEIERALRGPDHEPVPCHNDLLAGNMLFDGETLCIVDWEYAGMGDRFFDLGNLAVNNGFDDAAEENLLGSYFGEPATPSRLAALRLMRFMSDFREAMWGALQGMVSEIDFDFEGYADQHFERLHRTAADPRFGGWLEEASVAPA